MKQYVSFGKEIESQRETWLMQIFTRLEDDVELIIALKKKVSIQHADWETDRLNYTDVICSSLRAIN